MSTNIPGVTWLFGPSGVGKTTLGSALYRRLSSQGAIAYVDVDQIGMCYPSPASDPDRYALKARNLGAAWNILKANGIAHLLVSSILKDEDTARLFTSHLGERPLFIRLRANEDELRWRFEHRGWNVHAAEDAVAHGRALEESHFADVTLDTAGSAPSALVEPVLSAMASRQRRHSISAFEPAMPRAPHPLHIVWISGVRGVGKSSVAFPIFMRLLKTGMKAGYVDLAQLSLFTARGAAGQAARIRARLLDAVLASFGREGARVIILCGPPRPEDLACASLENARIDMFELVADRQQLRDRLYLRAQGEGPQLPGDDLIGMDLQSLNLIAEKAAPLGHGQSVETSACSAEEVADLIYRQIDLRPR